jgi:hypothetical protein
MNFGMSFAFFNPWMLAGLAGIGLPLLVHLLSRKKYDIVSWGAMQFLELGRNAKRRVQLEELMLMLLRMALLALLAIALARPWLSGSMVSSLASRPTSDIVIVLDSSYSTDWRGKATTPHAAALRWINRFLDDCEPGDTVALLDARDQVTAPEPALTRNFEAIRQTLLDLPAPSGSSHLNEAIVKGLQLLNTGSNLSRQVVVVTDSQSLPWADTDDRFWLQMKELRGQARIPADVWVVGTQRQQARRINYSVDQLELSRELTVVDFPIRFRTTIRNTGAKAGSKRRVFLEVDGQRLADRSVTVQVEPNGQVTAEFEHRFQTPGSHRISVSIEEDSLPADDRADAAIVIADALPALLIDGNPNADPTRSEMFFASLALSPPGNETPWIQARTVPVAALQMADLTPVRIAVLANAARLTDAQVTMLQSFVDQGGGLAITLGDQTDRDWFNAKLFADGSGMLPGLLESHEKAPDLDEEDTKAVTILGESLTLPWISGFQAGSDDGFLDARFSDWFKVTPASANEADAALIEKADDETGPPSRESAIVAARLTNGDPLIVTRRYGRGDVGLLTSTIDADWNTLPTKPDYVAFLHELVFRLASARSSRNVETGTPLVLSIEPGDTEANWTVVDPEDNESTPVKAGDELNPAIRFDGTWLPGVYEFRRTNPGGNVGGAVPQSEVFVVNFDRSESDLEPLADERWGELTGEERLRRINEPGELFSAIQSDSARVEIWQLLLFVFLAILVGEVLMTRRLVQGGHQYGRDEEDDLEST